jgi:hypothetical protein
VRCVLALLINRSHAGDKGHGGAMPEFGRGAPSCVPEGGRRSHPRSKSTLIHGINPSLMTSHVLNCNGARRQ